MRDSLFVHAANPTNPNWERMIQRQRPLYQREPDIRSEFARDFTRIIHTTGYRRMKHKTQVFFSPQNDHICTRVEHISHVESISYTIAQYLGLNTELTKAIATAHDLGHSPFGHDGEKILSEIAKRDLGETFWHEKNGLNMVDKIELLEDPDGNKQNINLTYAVRDGIISHCGEIDENKLKPRKEFINLDDYKYPNQFAPYTWEGCVVKIADKISYLGRDISDAVTLGILDEHLYELYKLLNCSPNEILNNTVIINELIYDLCENTNIEDGLCFSDQKFALINKLKEFNYKNIYFSDKLAAPRKYFSLVLNEIYDTLKRTFTDKERVRKMCPEVVEAFENWLINYWNLERLDENRNDIIFDANDEKDYCRAIIYYISGMTDNYAIDTYNKIITF